MLSLTQLFSPAVPQEKRRRVPSPLKPDVIETAPVLRALDTSSSCALRATGRYWRDRINARIPPPLTPTQIRWASPRPGCPDMVVANDLYQAMAVVRSRINVFPETSWPMELLLEDWRVWVSMVGNNWLISHTSSGPAVFDGIREGRPRWSHITCEYVSPLTVSDNGTFAVGVRKYDELALWEKIPRRCREQGRMARLKARVRPTPGYVLRACAKLPQTLSFFYDRRIWFMNEHSRDTLRVLVEDACTLTIHDHTLRLVRRFALPHPLRSLQAVAFHTPTQTYTAVYRTGQLVRGHMDSGTFSEVQLAQSTRELPNMGLATIGPFNANAFDQDHLGQAFSASHLSPAGTRLTTFEALPQRRTRVSIHDVTQHRPVLLLSHTFARSVAFLSSDAEGNNIALRSASLRNDGKPAFGFVHMDVAQKEVRDIQLQHCPSAVHWANSTPAIGALELRAQKLTQVLLFKRTNDTDVPIHYSLLREDKDRYPHHVIGFDGSGRYLFQYGGRRTAYDEIGGVSYEVETQVRVFDLAAPSDPRSGWHSRPVPASNGL